MSFDSENLLTSPAPTPNVAPSQLQNLGRPRLVAKTTSSLTQKVKPFRTAAPDPMQVWNKNRITPQPSTKNLTDEELKQQYGIHLTSRIQSDGDGKEAKWADIDDDEDDWAPETIEWGDGTKSTVPTDALPVEKSEQTPVATTSAIELPTPVTGQKQPTTISTSIGPNATVLKLGARAEIQQAQKAATQPKGPQEKLSIPSRTLPAPAPAKSPWAKLPPVEKVSPVEIVPNGLQNHLNTGYINNASAAAASPAREISADDFNRSFREPPSQQLFNATSGRYEAVPSGKRRDSRNDGFRPPAVLQRPSQADTRGPEPSAAFQTNRTSSDAYRRRTSSIISGGSGNLMRRMSIKSGENPVTSTNNSAIDTSEIQPTQTQPANNQHAYQARGGDQTAQPGQTDAEIEAQRIQQRKLMREQADLARKRRLEEEARQEAEKKERIRQKLLSLGPDPKIVKAEQEAQSTNEAPVKAAVEGKKDIFEQSGSPPKPPQPNASGEPQQYGMMKVHAIDSHKKGAVQPPTAGPRAQVDGQSLPTPTEDISPEPPFINGTRPDPMTSRSESNGHTDSLNRSARPVSATPESRGGWGRSEHRSAANLWTAPHNKALGNGTFDQTLAGYAPQDLSSRASSTGQGWMNGRTPTVGQSPPLSHSNQTVPETRSQTLQTMTSPEPTPLAMNSEIDSMFPVRPPAPIGPPPQPNHNHGSHVNGFTSHHAPASTPSALAGWNNFGNAAKAKALDDRDQTQRDVNARREEEQRTGARSRANYQFAENIKHVQLGQQPGQRHVNTVNPSSTAPPGIFGAVGSVTSATSSQNNRASSRFFKQQTRVDDVPSQQQVVTIHNAAIPRTPSPPPAEEMSSMHPVYEMSSATPIVKLPRAKAVVKLPPARSASPVEPSPAAVPETEPTSTPQDHPVRPALPAKPMSWAARVSMAPPPPPVQKTTAPSRIISQPIAQTTSWQERFNGLLGNKQRRASEISTSQSNRSALPALAVTSATKEPLDVMPAGSASVSLPNNSTNKRKIEMIETRDRMKSVEEEEDLFEDREPGSLPHLHFPTDAPGITWPQPVEARIKPLVPDVQSATIYLATPWKEERSQRQHYVFIRLPEMTATIRKELPLKQNDTSASNRRNRPPIKRGTRAGKHHPRQTYTQTTTITT